MNVGPIGYVVFGAGAILAFMGAMILSAPMFAFGVGLMIVTPMFGAFR